MDSELVGIGDFSRMTYLTVKALRHYQDVGLLEPWSVDPFSGYRSYHLSQVPIAQVIRRLRDLDMPLDGIRAVVRAPDVDARNRAIGDHLRRMEDHLNHTRAAVASLRSLLDRPTTASAAEIRSLPAQWTLAIRETVPMATAGEWARGAFGELYATLDRLGTIRTGLDGGLFHDDFFNADAGELVAFVPVDQEIEIPHGTDRITAFELPAIDAAVMTHAGSGATIDQTYAELGAFVSKRAIGVAGPIREYFTVTAADTSVEADHRTEVAWPVFRTGADPDASA